MRPTLKIEEEDQIRNGFINAYMKDVDCQMEYTDCAFLLFKPPDIDVYNHFVEKEYERTQQLIDDYDYEGGYCVLVYKLDVKFKEDFEKVKKGMYSKTSKEFQNLFKKVKKVVRNGLHNDEITLQHLIFRKSPDLKKYWEDKIEMSLKDEFETWTTWVEEKETLDVNNLKLEE